MGMIEAIVVGEAADSLERLARSLDAWVHPFTAHARGVGAAGGDGELEAALNRVAAAISTMTQAIGEHVRAEAALANNTSKDLVAATGGPTTKPPKTAPGTLLVIPGSS